MKQVKTTAPVIKMSCGNGNGSCSEVIIYTLPTAIKKAA